MAGVDGLADELLDALYEREPLYGTLDGFRDRDDRLADHSEAGDAAAAARFRDVLARARALGPAPSTRDRVTMAVIEAHATAALDRLAARGVEYTITPLYHAPVAQLLYGLPLVGIETGAHAEAYLARLRAIPDLVETVAGRHRSGLAAGRLPVRRLVDGAVAHLDRHLAGGVQPLRRPEPPGDGAAVAAFRAERDRLVDGVVRPALARYRAVLAEEIAPNARPDERAGLCWLPGGEGTYERLARAHTTTGRTAEELHRTGLDLVERLAAEYRAIGGRLFGPIEPADLFARLRGDQALRWRDGTEILAAARAAIARAERAAPAWFGRLPGQPCLVEEVPPEEAPEAPGGNYLRAATDGSRPAIYLANTHRPEERDRYTAEAVAFHEAVPGHHVQLALAQELTDLPALRRLAPIDAFAEGWGLYAERLADEMGLYSGDLARLGMVAGDSVRAARLVVDTGLHALGWGRDRAVAFMREHTPLPPVDVDREVDRYVADPGQALAYMVGRLELERLRDEARRVLGDRFDIRGFHDAVLSNGEIPLRTLAEVVAGWTYESGMTETLITP
jgi:uncharacterized protein (DUF885 family)